MRALRWSPVVFLFSLTTCGGGDPSPEHPDPDAGGPTTPACRDGIDNDGDGAVDFPGDPGCDDPDDETEDSAARPACSDHRDNDGDGATDYPLDPGCRDAFDADEADDCPDGPGCPQCANHRDDDLNGTIDYPDDVGCDSAGDTSEFADDPHACGAGLRILPLPPSGFTQGTLDSTSTTTLPTSCGGGLGAPAVAYVFLLTQPEVFAATTDSPATTADTILSIRRADCTAADAVLGCNDNITAANHTSSLAVSLPAGTFYLIVEATSTSNYELFVQHFAGEGTVCTMPIDCGPGLVCRVPLGETQMVCARPVCSDGVDDDGDGELDYPNDPGCTSPDDATEDDDCPAGPGCPQCSDGLDNDGDTMIDYPGDPSCTAASSNSEACSGEQDPIVDIVTGTTTGTLVGAHDDHNPACVTSNGADVVFTLTVPKMATLRLSTENSALDDSVLSLMASTCGEPSLACDDDSGVTPAQSSVINAANLPAGNYTIAVDAFGPATVLATFQLAVSGTIAPGGSCEVPLFASGAFICQGGLTCDGPPGMRICRSECSDGIDNNGDGRVDFPNDPGCTSAADSTENTVCPGATCPACADGVDNDGDMTIDYPLDISCGSASATSEQCDAEQDPILPIVTGVTMGTLIGAHDDHDPSCVASNAPDVLYTLTLPAMATLRLSTENSALLDSVLSLLTATCAEPALACDDDSGVTPTASSVITQANLAAGTYFVAVDAFNATTVLNTFQLAVSGTIAPGGSCATPLFTSGAITCSAGHPCMAGTCQ